MPIRLNIGGGAVFVETGAKSFDSDLPTVVFLHGSGLDHTFWQLQSRCVDPRKYSVLVPDLPGHSNSDGPPLHSIERMAEWLHNVLEEVKAASISLIAHSQGCLIALEYAARYGNNVKGMSLIASGLATPVNPALIDAARSDPESAIEMMISWSIAPPGQGQVAPSAESSAANRLRKVLRSNAPEPLAADLAACNAYSNGRAAAADVRCPVQVILADGDRMVPRDPDAQLIEHLNGAELHVIVDCGHMIPLEKPDETCSILSQFVTRNNPPI